MTEFHARLFIMKIVILHAKPPLHELQHELQKNMTTLSTYPKRIFLRRL